MHLAQDKYQWPALVNTVTTYGSHKRRGICLLTERLLPFQEGLCLYSMELVKMPVRNMYNITLNRISWTA